MDSSQQDIEKLRQRYVQLREMNRKTHLCGFYFRQRCLKTIDKCQFAHGLTDLKRIPSTEILKIRQELFNIKQKLKLFDQAVIFNYKSKRFEIYKIKDLIHIDKELQQDYDMNKFNAMADDDEEEGEENDGTNNTVEEQKQPDQPDSKPQESKYIKKCIKILGDGEYELLKEAPHPHYLHKFDMNKVLDSDDEYNKAKRRPRNKVQLSIVRPWQNEIMANFLKLLFKEFNQDVIPKETILKKYNEAGVPITWARLVSCNILFEKKSIFPPWSINQKITLVALMKQPEENVRDLEDSVIEIIKDVIAKEKEQFQLPIRLSDIQKEIQMRLLVNRPPLFVLVKQLDTTVDNLFYKVLEERGYIKKNIIHHLQSDYSSEPWAQQVIEGLNDESLNLFMKFSHQAQLAIELIEKELQNHLLINVIVEEGQFLDYFNTKYLKLIKSNDLFKQIVNELLAKHNYKKITIGTGIYLINPSQFNENISQVPEDGIQKFCYSSIPCEYCCEQIPDEQTLTELLDQKFMYQLEEQGIQRVFSEEMKIENHKIFLVNDYLSLRACFEGMKNQKYLGIDLEGRLRKNGSINLIQIACETEIFIIDIYQITKIDQNWELLEYVSQVLKFVFLDEKIVKVFFDGKKDVEALHFILKVGTRKFLDAQAIHMLVFQLQEFQRNKKIMEMKNVVTPGLNDVLSKYKVKHGINPLKKQFKAIFDDWNLCKKYFNERPIDKDFVKYSSYDVIDLGQLIQMQEQQIQKALEKTIPKQYTKLLMEQLSDTYSNKSCQKVIKPDDTDEQN